MVVLGGCNQGSPSRPGDFTCASDRWRFKVVGRALGGREKNLVGDIQKGSCPVSTQSTGVLRTTIFSIVQ